MDVPSDDPFAKLLAEARLQAQRADKAWYVSGFVSDETLTAPGALSQWHEVIRLLEALSVAARVSRTLHKQCVTLPSRDIAHYFNVVTLHELLMQQLRSLEIGCVADQERASAVPSRPAPAPLPVPLVWIEPMPTPSHLPPRPRLPEGPGLPRPRPGEDWTVPIDERSPLAEEEQGGGMCTIT